MVYVLEIIWLFDIWENFIQILFEQASKFGIWLFDYSNPSLIWMLLIGIHFQRESTEKQANWNISTFFLVPLGLVGFEVCVPPCCRVLWHDLQCLYVSSLLPSSLRQNRETTHHKTFSSLQIPGHSEYSVWLCQFGTLQPWSSLPSNYWRQHKFPSSLGSFFPLLFLHQRVLSFCYGCSTLWWEENFCIDATRNFIHLINIYDHARGFAYSQPVQCADMKPPPLCNWELESQYTVWAATMPLKLELARTGYLSLRMPIHISVHFLMRNRGRLPVMLILHESQCLEN